jgi:hypothetical protein
MLFRISLCEIVVTAILWGSVSAKHRQLQMYVS